MCKACCQVHCILINMLPFKLHNVPHEADIAYFYIKKLYFALQAFLFYKLLIVLNKQYKWHQNHNAVWSVYVEKVFKQFQTIVWNKYFKQFM